MKKILLILLLLAPSLVYTQSIQDYFKRVKKTTSVVTPQYNITVTQPDGCVIVPNGLVLVDSNATQDFTITAEFGWTLDSLHVDGALVTPPTSYKFEEIADNHTLQAYTHQGIFYLVSVGKDTLVSSDGDYIVTLQ